MSKTRDDREKEKRQYSPINAEKAKAAGLNEDQFVAGHNDFMNTVFMNILVVRADLVN